MCPKIVTKIIHRSEPVGYSPTVLFCTYLGVSEFGLIRKSSQLLLYINDACEQEEKKTFSPRNRLPTVKHGGGSTVL